VLFRNSTERRSYTTTLKWKTTENQRPMVETTPGLSIRTSHSTRCRYSIYHQTKAWLEPGHETMYKVIDPLLTKANTEQQILGWRQFIRGRLLLTWGRNNI
jgi:hypothetical protein